MIVPNCLHNTKVGNKDLQSGHCKLLLVSAKPDSGKVTDVNGSMFFRPVRVSVNFDESFVSTEGNLTTSEMIHVTAVNCGFLILNLLSLENSAEGSKKKDDVTYTTQGPFTALTGKLSSCS